jgi:hypothetical protein
MVEISAPHKPKVVAFTTISLTNSIPQGWQPEHLDHILAEGIAPAVRIPDQTLEEGAPQSHQHRISPHQRLT